MSSKASEQIIRYRQSAINLETSVLLTLMAIPLWLHTGDVEEYCPVSAGCGVSGRVESRNAAFIVKHPK